MSAGSRISIDTLLGHLKTDDLISATGTNSNGTSGEIVLCDIASVPGATATDRLVVLWLEATAQGQCSFILEDEDDTAYGNKIYMPGNGLVSVPRFHILPANKDLQAEYAGKTAGDLLSIEAICVLAKNLSFNGNSLRVDDGA